MRKKNKGRSKKFNKAKGVIDFQQAAIDRLNETKERSLDMKRYEEESDMVEVFLESQSQALLRVRLENQDEDGAKTRTQSKHDVGISKEEAKKRRRIRRRRSLIYVCIFLILISLVGITAYDLIVLKLETRSLRQEEVKLKKEKESLKEELGRVNDPEYIEQQARKQLRLILPGETLYVLPTEDQKKENTREESKETTEKVEENKKEKGQ